MLVMFIVGFVIFAVYLYALLRAIYWGHKSQRDEMINDPELRNYYARHHLPPDREADFIDYDGHGNYGRFPVEPSKKKKRKILTLSFKDKKKVKAS